MRAFLEHQAKLGADAGLTVGVFGGGLEASTTTNLGADVLAFAHSVVGAFGGVAPEGAVLVRRKDLNEAYYGARRHAAGDHHRQIPGEPGRRRPEGRAWRHLSRVPPGA